jgi:hypothetical protein
MADPYLPPQPVPFGQERTPRDTVHIETTREIPVVPVVVEKTSAFGTGMLVAAVFVVVAILAAVLYQRSDTVVLQPAPAATEATPAPAVVEPAPATKDAAPANTTVVPDAAEPDAGAEPAAPVPVPPATDSVEP